MFSQSAEGESLRSSLIESKAKKRSLVLGTKQMRLVNLIEVPPKVCENFVMTFQSNQRF